MERLTEHFGRYIRIKGLTSIYSSKYSKTARLNNAIIKLTTYEDAMPLERVQELAQAEKDGRLVVLTPNDPLTLEELRGMDGEPVWLSGDGLNKYDIFHGECVPGWADFYWGRLSFYCYSKDWLAYRRKPEEETA